MERRHVLYDRRNPGSDNEVRIYRTELCLDVVDHGGRNLTYVEKTLPGDQHDNGRFDIAKRLAKKVAAAINFETGDRVVSLGGPERIVGSPFIRLPVDEEVLNAFYETYIEEQALSEAIKNP